MTEAEQNDETATEGEKKGSHGHAHAHSHGSGGSKKKRILLVPYPKFIFLYPTLIVTSIATIFLWWGGHTSVDPKDTMPVVMTGLFMAVMMANMFVIVFDFPRATSLTLVFIVTTVGMGLWLLFLSRPDMLQPCSEKISTKGVVDSRKCSKFAPRQPCLYAT